MKKKQKVAFGKQGKFYIDPAEHNGFLRGPNFQDKTQIYGKNCRFNGRPATVVKIYLGSEEGQRLNHDLVPDDTEAIFLYNLERGQVIHWLHYYKKHEDVAKPDSLKIVLRPFSNSFIGKDERLEAKDFFTH